MSAYIPAINMKSCRICLTTNKPMCPLFKYKLSGNYAEMLTSIADVKVSSYDGLPDKICCSCCRILEKAHILKALAEKTDRKLRNILANQTLKLPTKKISFDSFKDVKTEIAPLAIKSEPKWEMEIEILNSNKPVETMEGKDIVIANTVIKKVGANNKDDDDNEVKNESANQTASKDIDDDAEYLEDDIFVDDDDEDYVPPTLTKKTKFKKPKLSEIKVLKKANEKKTFIRKVKVLKTDTKPHTIIKRLDPATGNMITCYPIMKNGSRGPPIMLKRPKDATVLKFHPNYKHKNTSEGSVTRSEKPIRIVRSARPIKNVLKAKEKLVCPVCGILTYTLGNHLTTHEEKKRYTCAECPKTFSQKSNLTAHMKQHSGIKDHVCEICGAAFYSQKSLVRHNLIHKGERPFPCTLCNKKFLARCDLTRHLRIHSGYKPYKCASCTMSFNAKHQLQNHERMHTGERPYTCQVCNVAFSYKVNLNNHVIKAHGVNLKFKSIHTVTEEVLRRELEGGSDLNEARTAIAHILPHLTDQRVPAHDSTVVSHEHSDYSI